MPTLADLRTRFVAPMAPVQVREESEEALVVDTRGSLSPAQMVDLKLRSALHGPTLSRAGMVTNSNKRQGPK